jgi:predicted unusual protein kinase regulating ubiquinone biosynthesis (AarF/ABC1/UbiB family)
MPKDKKPSSSSEEKKSTIKKMGRYAKVGSTAAPLAMRLLAQKYFDLDLNKQDHAEALKAKLGALKGPLLKVAQLLATIPNALPREYTEQLMQLQSQAPPMGPFFVKRRMASELGAEWQGRFKHFEETAAAAASLGQVHRAILKDGRQVACKLQYPDMQSAVSADLDQLKVFLAVFEKVDGAIITKDIFAELEERLYEELDYAREAKHTKVYRHILKDVAGVYVPEVVGPLSTARLLTTTWCDGRGILNYKDAKVDVRSRLAFHLFQAWYVPLYHYGLIHGDPHLGNYTVRDDLAINVLDFGCVRVFPPSFVEGVITLYEALRDDDEEKAAHAYALWGFKKLNKDLLAVLNTWAHFLYGPILDNQKRKIGDVGEGIYGREIAEKVHAELKKKGGTHIPREFVFMDRAALGLGSVFLHLKAEMNWYQIFNDLIADFDVKTLAKKQQKLLADFDL